MKPSRIQTEEGRTAPLRSRIVRSGCVRRWGSSYHPNKQQATTNRNGESQPEDARPPARLAVKSLLVLSSFPTPGYDNPLSAPDHPADELAEIGALALHQDADPEDAARDPDAQGR